MPTLIAYKKANLRFERLHEYAAGIELFGQEVKSLRAKLGSLEGSRVIVRGGESYLVGMTIPAYQTANAPKDYDTERPGRLLLTKKEMRELAAAESQKGLTLVPFELYTSGRNVKVRLGIVRGKGRADRREDLKKRDAFRETARILKNR